MGPLRGGASRVLPLEEMEISSLGNLGSWDRRGYRSLPTGWRYVSVVEYLFTTHKALGSIAHTANTNNGNNSNK